jgi:hypothetical protein
MGRSSLRRDGDIFQGSSACSSSTGMRTPRTRPDSSAWSAILMAMFADSLGSDDK